MMPDSAPPLSCKAGSTQSNGSTPARSTWQAGSPCETATASLLAYWLLPMEKRFFRTDTKGERAMKLPLATSRSCGPGQKTDRRRGHVAKALPRILSGYVSVKAETERPQERIRERFSFLRRIWVDKHNPLG